MSITARKQAPARLPRHWDPEFSKQRQWSCKREEWRLRVLGTFQGKAGGSGMRRERKCIFFGVFWAYTYNTGDKCTKPQLYTRVQAAEIDFWRGCLARWYGKPWKSWRIGMVRYGNNRTHRAREQKWIVQNLQFYKFSERINAPFKKSSNISRMIIWHSVLVMYYKIYKNKNTTFK